MTRLDGELHEMVRALAAMPPADRAEVIDRLGDDGGRRLAPLLDELTTAAHSDEFLLLIGELADERRPPEITAPAAAAIRAAHRAEAGVRPADEQPGQAPRGLFGRAAAQFLGRRTR
jgi:hypothetical protein